ncbi:MAG: CocE/NonD family hydrolase [Armatimonadota bacterium]
MSNSLKCYLLIGALLLMLAVTLIPEPVESAPTMTEMVQMRDGTKLVTDIYLPDDNRDKQYPTILIRSPYPRVGSTEFLKFGFALAYQSTRGRNGSEGKDVVFYDDAWGKNQDGYDTVEWIAKQSWCNGKIGTYGASAPGITQYMLVGSNPPSLDCITPMFAGSNLYQHVIYQGGAYRKEMLDPWIEGNQFDPDFKQNIINNPAYNNSWQTIDLSTVYKNTNVPALHIAGWYDIFQQSNIDAFMGMQYHGGKGAIGKQKLIIGPYSHGAFEKVGELTFPRISQRNVIGDILNWLNYNLKGEENDISKMKAVTYYTMGAVGEKGAPGNRWHSSDVWPVPSQPVSYYIHKDGSLSPNKPTEKSASKTYEFNPDNPVPMVGGPNLVSESGPYDQRKVENRPDVLLFETEPLTEPINVTGRLKVRLWASSSAKDTDFTAKLTDVYPDGRSMLISDGIIRARYRKSFEKPEMMKAGKTCEFEIDLWSTSIIFNKGHKIRLAISSSNTRFDVNPNTGEEVFKATRKEIAKNTIYFDSKHPSAIILPVVK